MPGRHLFKLSYNTRIKPHNMLTGTNDGSFQSWTTLNGCHQKTSPSQTLEISEGRNGDPNRSPTLFSSQAGRLGRQIDDSRQMSKTQCRCEHGCHLEHAGGSLTSSPMTFAPGCTWSCTWTSRIQSQIPQILRASFAAWLCIFQEFGDP